jgi:elongation factor P hydroxylase
VSVSGRVVGLVSTGIIEIEPNAFTSPFSLLNAPKTDREAFEQTLQRIVTLPKTYECMLCDEYGTPYGITADYIGGSGNLLEFSDASFDGAVAGDIIVMEFANNAFPTYPEDLAACWDAYQADTTGLVNADADFAYPWSR